MQGRAATSVHDLLKMLDKAELPQGFDETMDSYQRERYIPRRRDLLLRLYYSAKPWIPRSVQMAFRRRHVARQRKLPFPQWPIEPVVVNLVGDYVREAIRLNGGEAPPSCAYWPDGKQFAFAITHDIEWDAGLRRAPAIAALEQKLGFISSWNFVPERYPIDWSILKALRADGFELGLHGLKHDGKLFSSRTVFESRLDSLRAYAQEWGLAGFRSPSTLRNAEWMHLLPFEYDSSFPDTDPYEPQPGGCCTIWPYFFGQVVELPLTMPQDHTLFDILGRRDIDLWRKKAEWIARHGGLVLINVHPDYMMTDQRLAMYEEFLIWMKSLPGMWHARPLEVARWWRERDASQVVMKDSQAVVLGPAAGRSTIVHAKPGDGVVYWTLHGLLHGLIVLWKQTGFLMNQLQLELYC